MYVLPLVSFQTVTPWIYYHPVIAFSENFPNLVLFNKDSTHTYRVVPKFEVSLPYTDMKASNHSNNKTSLANECFTNKILNNSLCWSVVMDNVNIGVFPKNEFVIKIQVGKMLIISLAIHKKLSIFHN